MNNRKGIFSMLSPERSLARKTGSCIQQPNSCLTCNCPARAKVACLMTQRSPGEFLESHEIPESIASIIRSLPRDVFEFVWWQDESWHVQRWTFPHPVLHELKDCPDNKL